jgi:hypothetical protein
MPPAVLAFSWNQIPHFIIASFFLTSLRKWVTQQARAQLAARLHYLRMISYTSSVLLAFWAANAVRLRGHSEWVKLLYRPELLAGGKACSGFPSLHLVKATLLVYLIYSDAWAKPVLQLLLRALFRVQMLQYNTRWTPAKNRNANACLAAEAIITPTPSAPNYISFDFFNPKFDHVFYSKNCAKYHIFLLYLTLLIKIFKKDLNLTIFAQFFFE